MVRTKLLVAVIPPPSVTVTVIVAFPLCPATGVMANDLEAPDPPKTRPLLGTRAGVLLETLSVKLATGVSLSPMVMEMGFTFDPLATN